MTPAEFSFVSEYLQERSGLSLTTGKMYLLESRLKPLAEHFQIADLSALVSRLRSDPKGALGKAVIEAMTTNETSFFRDRTPFDGLAEKVLPKLLNDIPAGRPLKIWCSAVSSGQEAYTLGMVLRENESVLRGRRIEILGTDLSLDILEKAKAGVYSQFEVQRGMPVSLLLKYFEQKGEMWHVKPDLKSMVTFRQFNLLDSFSSMPQFDLIFCRNVLIYFDIEMKKAVLAKVSKVLAPYGYLSMGAAETVVGLSDTLQVDKSLRNYSRHKTAIEADMKKSA